MSERSIHPLLLPNELVALRDVGIEKRFLPGDRLVSIGALSTEVFYLTSGLVKIVVVAETGTESVFGLRTPGVFIGDMATLNNERRSADVVAVESTTAVMVSADNFTRYLETNPSVAIAMLRMQSRRLNEMTERSMLGGRSVKARIAQRLLELSTRSERDGVVELTQSDLAQFIDASREWTSKALGELRREGAIETERGRVIILDELALRDALLDS
jgi:CRP/FNR family cyclic AMP-dependent transcriptional regulator